MYSSDSTVGKLRRHYCYLKDVVIFDRERNNFPGEIVAILDALKKNTVVEKVYVRREREPHYLMTRDRILTKVNEIALVKLSEVMKCNTSVETLIVDHLHGGLLRDRLFAIMATSGGWSSIQKLSLFLYNGDIIKPLSITDAKNISSFVIQSENLHTLSLGIAGDEAAPILEALSRTNVQSLKLDFHLAFFAHNRGTRIAAALERCTCITELELRCQYMPDTPRMDFFFQHVFHKSIPKMVGLKKLHVVDYKDRFFGIVGRCIERNPGVIEELELTSYHSHRNLSIVGSVPALKMIKVIQFSGGESVKLDFASTFSAPTEGRRLAAALERCTCITELELRFHYLLDARVAFFQTLFLELIPKMLGLKKLHLQLCVTGRPRFADHKKGFFDMVGRCIEMHPGVIEELELTFYHSRRDHYRLHSSIVGLVPALKKLKVIRFSGTAPTLQQIGELWEGASDCETLEEFSFEHSESTDDFKATCQLCSRFPSLKRVSQGSGGDYLTEVEDNSAVLEMLKTSKTIEQVPSILSTCPSAEERAAIEHHGYDRVRYSRWTCRSAKERATIKHHCRNNMMHNRIELVSQKGLLAANVPHSAWPLILEKFSDTPDVLYYLVQQKHSDMVRPACN